MQGTTRKRPPSSQSSPKRTCPRVWPRHLRQHRPPREELARSGGPLCAQAAARGAWARDLSAGDRHQHDHLIADDPAVLRLHVEHRDAAGDAPCRGRQRRDDLGRASARRTQAAAARRPRADDDRTRRHRARLRVSERRPPGDRARTTLPRTRLNSQSRASVATSTTKPEWPNATRLSFAFGGGATCCSAALVGRTFSSAPGKNRTCARGLGNRCSSTELRGPGRDIVAPAIALA
jgi:hypothetical protein